MLTILSWIRVILREEHKLQVFKSKELWKIYTPEYDDTKVSVMGVIEEHTYSKICAHWVP
jgi:hypothetical protein